MAVEINTRLRFKKDTAANLADLTLLDGEPVVNENLRLKLGTGATYKNTPCLLSKPMINMPSTSSVTVTKYDRYTVASGPNYDQELVLLEDDDHFDMIFPCNSIIFYDDKIRSDAAWEAAVAAGFPMIPYSGGPTLNQMLRNGTEIVLDSTKFPNFSWQVGESLDIYTKNTRDYCSQAPVNSYVKIGSLSIGADQKIYLKITQTTAGTNNKRLWTGTTAGTGKGTYVDSVPGDTDTYPDGGVYDNYYYEKNGTTTMPVVQLNNFNYFESCIRLTNSNTTGVQIAANVYPVATEIAFSKEGSGKNIFMAASGVFLRSPNNVKLITSQYEFYRLKQILTNEWVLIGG